MYNRVLKNLQSTQSTHLSKCLDEFTKQCTALAELCEQSGKTALKEKVDLLLKKLKTVDSANVEKIEALKTEITKFLKSIDKDMAKEISDYTTPILNQVAEIQKVADSIRNQEIDYNKQFEVYSSARSKGIKLVLPEPAPKRDNIQDVLKVAESQNAFLTDSDKEQIQKLEKAAKLPEYKATATKVTAAIEESLPYLRVESDLKKSESVNAVRIQKLSTKVEKAIINGDENELDDLSNAYNNFLTKEIMSSALSKYFDKEQKDYNYGLKAIKNNYDKATGFFEKITKRQDYLSRAEEQLVNHHKEDEHAQSLIAKIQTEKKRLQDMRNDICKTGLRLFIDNYDRHKQTLEEGNYRELKGEKSLFGSKSIGEIETHFPKVHEQARTASKQLLDLPETAAVNKAQPPEVNRVYSAPLSSQTASQSIVTRGRSQTASSPNPRPLIQSSSLQLPGITSIDEEAEHQEISTTKPSISIASVTDIKSTNSSPSANSQDDIISPISQKVNVHFKRSHSVKTGLAEPGFSEGSSTSKLHAKFFKVTPVTPTASTVDNDVMLMRDKRDRSNTDIKLTVEPSNLSDQRQERQNKIKHDVGDTIVFHSRNKI